MKKELLFSSERSNISKVEQLVDEVSESLELSPEVYGNMMVCAVEAVRNAIIHGNRLDPHKEIFVKIENSDDKLTFLFRDEGKGFDFANIPDPTAPENLEKPFGRGIFLIKNLSDGMEFHNMGTEIEITFNIDNIKTETVSE